jgi:hypothetical protein
LSGASAASCKQKKQQQQEQCVCLKWQEEQAHAVNAQHSTHTIAVFLQCYINISGHISIVQRGNHLQMLPIDLAEKHDVPQ